MAQVSRNGVDLDTNSARKAPQISGLVAGEDGIKAGMACRVDSNGEIVRADATNKGKEADVDGFAARDADQGEPLTLYGEGVRFRWDDQGGLTAGDILYVDTNPGELNDEPTAGDASGVARAISSEDIVVLQLGQREPVESTDIAGGSAGDHSVSGIEVGDVLEHVFQAVGARASTPDVTDLVDLTDEFSIASDGTINNSGGTDTTDDALIVIYRDLT